MNKQDVIRELAPKLNVNQDEARVILNKVLEVLANSLTELDEDERLKLVGFANFQKIRRKGRLGRNPKTGEEVEIPEKLIIKTTISENLVDSFNE
ncbi:DNA-binding protein HRm [Psychrobacter pasteurii]|uniref:DNA-binding protein HRm n=1 Tax=Psychrobacter pasteurii TaxID=1945520 RepID=A0A1R4EC29_9GAMM|nr:HU family DNA-binding protein [Psychrobacter pasteurii]SJM36062.1 DNA-binding protein HRm [Psychrobacter pasteurii]